MRWVGSFYVTVYGLELAVDALSNDVHKTDLETEEAEDPQQL